MIFPLSLCVAENLSHFILTPLKARLRRKAREIEVERPLYPLSFNGRHRSNLWRQQIAKRLQTAPRDVAWAHGEIFRVVSDHTEGKIKNILESDVLRTAGALSLLGLQLGPYVGRFYDCDPSHFQFLNLLPYACPVEIKKHSRDFKYQMLRYKPLPRAVILCVDDNLVNRPSHIDVLELRELCRYLSETLGKG